MVLGDKESEWSDEATVPGGTDAGESIPSASEWSPEKLEEERENIKRMLSERLERHDESRKGAQEKLHEICEELRAQVDELCEKINSELEGKFTAEDNRLQTILSGLSSDEDGDVSKKIQRARTELLVEQIYGIVVKRNLIEKEENEEEYYEEEEEYEDDIDEYYEDGYEGYEDNYEGYEDEEASNIASLYELQTERNVVSLELIYFEKRKPTDLVPSFTEKGELSLSFSFFSEDEVEVLKGVDSHFEEEVKIWEKGHEDETSKTFAKDFTLGSDEAICFKSTFTARTTYCLKMRIVLQEMSTQWSDETEFTTPEFKDLCVWKECPDGVDEDREYSVDGENPRIATKISFDDCTIVGNTPLPLNTVTSWSIKILKSRDNNRGEIYIGVAPSDINQNESDHNYNKCGWYFSCYSSKLTSGPPHNYWDKEYGPSKDKGEYVRTGDSVGVVMDTIKGELSFVLNGVNFGVAYEGIPLDKPLVPCVLLGYGGYSVELDTSEVKETVVDSSIPVPSNITTKNTTWDSITLTWDVVDGASFYQLEVDGSKFWSISTTNAFTKRGLLPESEHAFRVRAAKESSAWKWSGILRGRTQKASTIISECIWKECPYYVDENRRYSVDEKNSRIATMVGDCEDYYCTIVGNTPLPLNTVTSWSIKILKSRDNNGGGIYIGVAPSDINQNDSDNYNKCGWYFHCWSSSLWSEIPHNYLCKKYGPSKDKGKYVRTGDSVGVIMDTTKGELSFVLKGVNFGVAYEGIPLDKPLVPCVILDYEGDSVELVI